MLNDCAFAGRLVRDPELRRTGSGIAVTSFTIAVERDIAGQDGKRETDFIDCVAWREKGEFVYKWFRKGSTIIAKGRMQSRDWTDKSGNKRKAWELQVEGVYFGGSKKDEDGSQQSSRAGYNQNGYGMENAYPETTAAINRYTNSGYGGYPPPQNPGDDFAMLTDDDAQLPF